VRVGDDRVRGFSTLLKELGNGSSNLLRAEVLLARLELTDIAANIARGTTAVVLGGVLLLLGGLSTIAGVVLVVGDQWLPRDRYWLAALVVMVVTGALAAWLVRRGLAQLSPSRLAPDQTLETLKEDKEWLKRQLTSGAT
jgi:uncharacterized membrane protein YqjE